jgi:hypothetical protein
MHFRPKKFHRIGLAGNCKGRHRQIRSFLAKILFAKKSDESWQQPKQM